MSYHYYPPTDHREKVLLGFVILLTAIWTVSSILAIIKFHREKNKESISYSFWEWYFWGHPLLGTFNWPMLFCYTVMIVVLLSLTIAQYL